MLNDLDAVAWDELIHAYGAAADTPQLLRQAGSADAEEAAEAISELYGSIFHQGTVYPATVAAIPFLAELAVRAEHKRAELVWMLGMLADDRHAYGIEFAEVKAAVAARLEPLLPLLADADPAVREAAAYAVTKAGVTAGPLWQRWAVEDDPAARAALVLALGEVDAAGAEEMLRDGALHGDPAIRTAAAVALLRAGLEWPDGTIPALVAAIDAGAGITYCWARGGEWSEEIVADPDPAVAVPLVEQLLRSANPKTRSSGLWALRVRCDAWRSAPPVFVPLIAPVLDDPDPEVRHEAMSVLRQAGAVAGRFADVLAGVAARFPEKAGDRGFTDEFRAVETLQRLGDPRWVEPVCRADVRHPAIRFWPGIVRFTPAVRSEIGEWLVAEPARAGVLAGLVAGWGPEAAPLVPGLVAALPHAGARIAAALLQLGHDEPAAVPYWRTRASENGDLAAALAVRRVTGEDEPVLGALRAVLAGPARAPMNIVPRIDELGAAVEPLLPLAASHLTGAADRVHPQRDKQILMARVVAAVAGPAEVLPTVEAVLAAGDTPARHAADLIADLAETSPAVVAHLEARLRDRLDDRWCRHSAARALVRLGVPVAELTEPLGRGITDYAGRFGVATVLELGAVATIPALEKLLGRDERSGVQSPADDVVWADELFQEQIRDAIARLRASFTTIGGAG